ncbi:MAG: molecular chaperone TorD family protein [Anaerolineae bacterium]|nr:molecular chaperone TorD family protein [Anaerolineae bacterium]
MDDRSILYEARLNVYALLQRLYQAAPDAELLGWLAAEHPFLNFPIELDEEANAALLEVDRDCVVVSADRLVKDFRQLYIGPGAMRVPPWESVYRNEEHLLFDRHTLQVREAYARHGMEFTQIYRAPEDSLAIELEFMKVLTERLLRAVELSDPEAESILLEEQREFVNRHLLIWVPQFVALTQKQAETKFYRGLAGVLNGFLTWEGQTLALMLETA